MISSMAFAPAHQTHSAIVRMQLVFGGAKLSIAQLGPDFLVLREKPAMPPGAGEIIMQVDESERRWPVRLPNGIVPGERKTPIKNLA
jgi:hypothetical protein